MRSFNRRGGTTASCAGAEAGDEAVPGALVAASGLIVVALTHQEAMNCPNCGAAMELSPLRGFYSCRYCGTFHFPESADTQGVRVLGPPDTALACPACEAPLVLAMLDDCRVHYCERCRGLLVPRWSFAEIIRRRRSWAEGPPVIPVPPDSGELRKTKNCPTCGARMIVDRYYGPGNIVIDGCPSCDSVWLDFGEMKQIVDAPGTDRGTRDPS